MVLIIASINTNAKTIIVDENDEVNLGVTGPVALKILQTLKWEEVVVSNPNNNKKIDNGF